MKHLTEEQIIKYRTGTLEAFDDYAVVERELATCSACQTLFQHVAHIQSAETAVAHSDVQHPEDDIIVRYTQSEANVTAQERDHIAYCSRCQADVASLRKYIKFQTMAPLPPRPMPGNSRRGVPENDRGYFPGGIAAFRIRWAAFSLCGMMAAAGLVWFVNQAAFGRVVAERDRLQQQLTAGRRINNVRPITYPSIVSVDVPDQTLKQLSQLNNRSATMGVASKNAVQLLRPKGMFVSSLQPTLAWKLQKPVSGASKYVITIVNTQTQNAPTPDEHVLTVYMRADENGGRTLPRPHFAPSEVERQVPAGWLKPATIYRWSVEVQGDKNESNLGSSSPNEETFFQTPTASEMGRLGQTYGAMGALDEAELVLSADKQNADSRKRLAAVRKLRDKLKK